MRLAGAKDRVALFAVVSAVIVWPLTLPAQTPSSDGSPAAGATQAASASPTTDPAPAASPTANAAAIPVKTYTVPSGTKVLLQLRSSLNTKSAKAGDGVYLTSSFPVVVGNRVMIPAGVFVQGTVDRVVR